MCHPQAQSSSCHVQAATNPAAPDINGTATLQIKCPFQSTKLQSRPSISPSSCHTGTSAMAGQHSRRKPGFHLEAGVCRASHSGWAVQAVLENPIVAAVQLVQNGLGVILQPSREEHHLCSRHHTLTSMPCTISVNLSFANMRPGKTLLVLLYHSKAVPGIWPPDSKSADFYSTSFADHYSIQRKRLISM